MIWFEHCIIGTLEPRISSDAREGVHSILDTGPSSTNGCEIYSVEHPSRLEAYYNERGHENRLGFSLLDA